ncbi:MAG: phosphoribosylamine--glycine ligase [Spirochaetaceae bacterium]|nr:phosphoribosylamine--glycine ligase [Spirochaetaceae bacterium]|tara:strand:+ start:443289 stop:444551 length:1263 start_codon:yes stop_codon:yes gene_type:complete
MKIALIGSGGREHAIYWKLKQSPYAQVHVFPGNAGIPADDRRKDVFSGSDFDSLKSYLESNKYDLLVVGPEQPLVDGIADALESVIPVFGPSKAAARIEGSKKWAKDFMEKYGIPTARSFSCSNVEEAYEALEQMPSPYVVKADGLAAGKGVTVTENIKEARHAVQDCLERKIFGDSGASLVIEQFLKGREASVFALCDGKRAIPFQPARDHKRAQDQDQGPNTGGMGAVTPVEYIDAKLLNKIQTEVLDRAMQGFADEGCPYKGLLYAGLMIDGDQINVVEFNCRFGDPETQALLPMLDEDLPELMMQCARGDLQPDFLRFRELASIIVVIAAEGYPGSYEKGIDMNPLLAARPESPDTLLFHAGTEMEGETIRSTGGRIAGVVASGSSIEDARKQAYSYLNDRKIERTFFRTDIGSLK